MMKHGSITAQIEIVILSRGRGVKVCCPAGNCGWFEVIPGKRTLPLLRKARAAVTEHLKQAHELTLKRRA